VETSSGKRTLAKVPLRTSTLRYASTIYTVGKILLTSQNLDTTNRNTFLSSFAGLVKYEWERHYNIHKFGNHADSAELVQQMKDPRARLSLDVMQTSLYSLTQAIRGGCGREVIVLIDGIDAPVTSSTTVPCPLNKGIDNHR
jgi:hypothetical protein